MDTLVVEDGTCCISARLGYWIQGVYPEVIIGLGEEDPCKHIVRTSSIGIHQTVIWHEQNRCYLRKARPWLQNIDLIQWPGFRRQGQNVMFLSNRLRYFNYSQGSVSGNNEESKSVQTKAS